MLSFSEALARIVALGSPVLASERVALDDADGRILAEDLVSAADLPPFDYSSMDGYAVRIDDFAPFASDGAAGSTRLPVVGESRTGLVPPALTVASTMRIFTGAPLPEGADAVVMQEKVVREGDVASFSARPELGQSVRRRGDDLRAGAVAIERGTRLRPGHLSLAATLDLAEVSVVKRPRVVIQATGDELRRPGTPARPGTIPESNTAALRAIARRAGASVAPPSPTVPDDRAAIERAFAAALDEADVFVTIGGVSVGDHDLVRPALEAVGVSLDFWRVAIKPGKPLVLGRFARPGRREAIVIGLPGNPSSAMVTFSLFGVPLLRALQGDPRPFPAGRRARLTHAFRHEPGRTEFARAHLTDGLGGALDATTVTNQASGAVTSMAESNGFVVVDAEVGELPAGAEVDVLFFDAFGA